MAQKGDLFGNKKLKPCDFSWMVMSHCVALSISYAPKVVIPGNLKIWNLCFFYSKRRSDYIGPKVSYLPKGWILKDLVPNMSFFFVETKGVLDSDQGKAKTKKCKSIGSFKTLSFLIIKFKEKKGFCWPNGQLWTKMVNNLGIL